MSAPTVLLSDEEDLLASVRPLRGGLALLPTSASADQVDRRDRSHRAPASPSSIPITPARSSARPSDDPLTPREREVLHLLAAGLGNKEIAGRLSISDHTAKFHVSQILAQAQRRLPRRSGLDRDEAQASCRAVSLEHGDAAR